MRYARNDDGTYTIFVSKGYGKSLKNMIDVLSGQAAEEAGREHWIRVMEEAPGKFTVVDDNMTVKGGDWVTQCTALGFMSWDDDVDDLDCGGSDAGQCFGMSESLRYRDVEMSPEGFSAPSIDALVEALAKVEIGAWCPGDI